jgi:serine/threonine-protein kinase
VAVTEGRPQLLCNVVANAGGNSASWGDDGWIVYSGWPAPGVWRCPMASGSPEQLTESDGQPPVIYTGAHVLPGARAVLFTTLTAGKAQIESLSLKTRRRRGLVAGGNTPYFAASGHLLYGMDNQLLAVPFDVEALELRGVPVPVLDGVRAGRDRSDFAVSDNGTLVYVAGQKLARRLLSANRKGQAETLSFAADEYTNAMLSPLGDRVATVIQRPAGRDVWIGELSRGTMLRLTSDGVAQSPRWSPDGKYIAYTSSASGQYNLFRARADGSGAAERLTQSAHPQLPTSWSRDGRLLLFNDIDPTTRLDVWALPLDGDRKPFALVNTRARELAGAFSPDGRWIAYQSDETGRYEVYVKAYPALGERHQVSNGGGQNPSWSGTGDEIFYVAEERLWRVPVQAGAALRLGRPEMLFERKELGNSTVREYDVNANATRFLCLEDVSPELAVPQLRVVVNWSRELRQRVPANFR